MSLSPAPSTLPTREAVRSVLIGRDLDRYIRRHLLTSVNHPIPSIGGGIALILVAMSALPILEGLWTGGLQTMLMGVGVGILTVGIPGVVAVATRHGGLWERPIREAIQAYTIAYLRLPTYGTPDFLTPVVNLLTLVATAPPYIAEAERYCYWNDTLQEARGYLEGTQTLADAQADRDTVRAHLTHLSAGAAPTPAPRQWVLLPVPPAREDPLLRRAEEQLAVAEARYQSVKTYLTALEARLRLRERHLRYAIAATELYLAEPPDPVVLPSMEPINPLPHGEAMRSLLA